MTAIPAKSALTGSSVTEGDFKTALETMIDYLTGLLGSSGTQAAALQSLGALGGSVTARATAYTVVAADRGQVVGCSGTWKLSLTSAATLGAGFVVAAVNTGSGVITIDPAGSETISGNATKSISAGESVVLVSNGVNWLLISGAQAYQSGFQLFTNPGSSTFTVPSGVTKLKATLIGGGGGGGAADTYNSGGNGGEGGLWCGYVDATPGSSMSVTVGSGGAANNNNSSGGSGSNSSFGGATAYGGGGGGYASGGAGNGGRGGVSSGGLGAFYRPFIQSGVRGNGLNSAAAIACSIDGALAPGVGGSGQFAQAIQANASGGVGGLVMIEW